LVNRTDARFRWQNSEVSLKVGGEVAEVMVAPPVRHFADAEPLFSCRFKIGPHGVKSQHAKVFDGADAEAITKCVLERPSADAKYFAQIDETDWLRKVSVQIV
jgi:hypothetical protein